MRVQRTRSSPSALREPLTRRPLGGLEFSASRMNQSLRSRVVALVAAVCLVAGARATAQPATPTPGSTHTEDVFVGRIVINTHVLNASGIPIAGLGKSDFRVAIDGRGATLESVEWVDESSQPDDAAVTGTTPGRMIVLLFQWEIANQKQVGFIRMQRQALNLIGSLLPGDRVAVAFFSSRLWLLQDFTSDHEQVARVVEGILTRRQEPAAADREPSLSGFLPNGGRDATSIEKALLALASGLEKVPGYKSLILFGWGAGVWQPTFQDQRTGVVRNTPEYDPARRALNRAETAVFCLDISDGDHPLSLGLERVAFDTGGFYLPTYLFPRFAIDRVTEALGGYYVLVVVKPVGAKGRHKIDVNVRTGQPNALVLHRDSYDDGEQP
jgi:VWFA-related protein